MLAGTLLKDADPEPTPRVPIGASGSLGAYVVNIESTPQAPPLVEVMVVPLMSQPVRVLKLCITSEVSQDLNVLDYGFTYQLVVKHVAEPEATTDPDALL